MTPATATRPQVSARLPVSDWQTQWRRQLDGRTVLEVTDQAGNLTGLVASTALAGRQLAVCSVRVENCAVQVEQGAHVVGLHAAHAAFGADAPLS
jgi:hypothetical protein